MKTLFSALYFAFIVDLLSFLKNIHSFFSWVYSWCSTDKSATENWERNSPNKFAVLENQHYFISGVGAWEFLLKTCLRSNLTGQVIFMKLKHSIPFLFIICPEYMRILLDMSWGYFEGHGWLFGGQNSLLWLQIFWFIFFFWEYLKYVVRLWCSYHSLLWHSIFALKTKRSTSTY